MAPPSTQGQGQFARLPVSGKIGLLAVVLGVIAAIYYFALHMPVADQIAGAKDQHTALIGQLDEAHRLHREFVACRSELDAREGIDQQNYHVLPEKAEIASFLEHLNRQAELSGLRIRLVEPRPEEAEELYVRIPVALQLSGTYHQLARFFYNVSRLTRAINLENIHLTEPAEQEESVILSASVLATTFRRLDAEEAAAAAQRQPGAARPNAAPAGRGSLGGHP